jgi:hypothetical protein
MTSTNEVKETRPEKATKLAVFHITQAHGKTLWVRVGVAFPNKDSSFNILLNHPMAKGAKLQVRADKARTQAAPAEKAAA